MRDRMVRKALQIETKICVHVCVMCKNEMTGERTAKAPMALQGRKLSSEGTQSRGCSGRRKKASGGHSLAEADRVRGWSGHEKNVSEQGTLTHWKGQKLGLRD